MKKVLIARLSSLGDILLTQPVIQAVGNQGDQVNLLVNPEFKELGGLLPGVTRVITPDEVNGKKFDIVLDLHRTRRSARALRHVQTGTKIKYPKYSLDRRLLVRPFGRPVFWNKWSSLDKPQSVVAWYSRAARQAGYRVETLIPRMALSPSDGDEVNRQLAAMGVDLLRPVIALAPGARWATKQWPVEYFIQLASRLATDPYQVVLVGGPAEVSLGQKIIQAVSGPVLSLIGQTTLKQLAGLLSKSPWLIANDSGPMHLGLAAGAKVIALFGPTVGAFGFMPEHPNARVLRVELPCQPCSLHGSKRCPLGHHDCMRSITVERVMEAIFDR